MSCDEWKAFLQDYVTGALSDPARAAIDRHLSECADCFSEARAHRIVEDRLRNQPAIPVPAGLVDRVVRAAAPAPSFRFRRELVRMAAAALVAVGVGLAFALGGFEAAIPAAEVEDLRHSLAASIRNALELAQDLSILR